MILVQANCLERQRYLGLSDLKNLAHASFYVDYHALLTYLNPIESGIG